MAKVAADLIGKHERRDLIVATACGARGGEPALLGRGEAIRHGDRREQHEHVELEPTIVLAREVTQQRVDIEVCERFGEALAIGDARRRLRGIECESETALAPLDDACAVHASS